MSNIFSIIVLAIIAIGMFKMFGRYIAVALACAVIGGIIGACTTNGSWETYAEYGAAAGFVLSFILYFKDAWLTFLGVIIGAAIIRIYTPVIKAALVRIIVNLAIPLHQI